MLYSCDRENAVADIAEKAYHQLTDDAWLDADRRIGLFFGIYFSPGPASQADQGSIETFQDRLRNGVRRRFRSDHDIRVTQLSPLTEISYVGSQDVRPWHTQSWTTWGIPLV